MRTPWVLGIAALLVFSLLYWGFDTKSSEQKALEKSRAGKFKIVDITVVEREARKQLPDDLKSILESIEFQYNEAEGDTAKAELLKQFSGYWYGNGHPALAGEYAKKVAEIEQTDRSWSIAGTTFAYGMETYDDERLQEYCASESRMALEKAVSINPDFVDHRINLALTYVDYPDEDNPMRGIQMLLQLNQQHPDNTGVLFQLARLGVETGQYEKARGRLEKILEIDPEEKRAICLLAGVYKEIGDTAKASEFQEKCDK